MSDLLTTAVHHHRGGRLQEAKALYRQVLAAEPDHPDALHLMGVLLLHQGESVAAAKLIRRAIGFHPDRADYHFNLGAALTALGDRDGAVAAYHQTLALRPSDADAHNNLGLLLAPNDKLSAEASFRAALDQIPNHIEAGVNLGRLLLADQRPQEAIACFDSVLQQQPAHAEALFGRGAAFAVLQHFKRAERDFRRLLHAQPENPTVLCRLGTLLIKQARMDEAIEVLRQGQALDPKNADILANLASAHEALGDLEAAEQAACQANALSPKAPGPLILLASVDHRRGRLAEARRSLETALAGQPSDERRCDALFELGQVLDRMGKAEAAYEAFLQANALQVDQPVAQRFDGRRFLHRIAANRAAFTPQGLAKMLGRLPAASSTPAPAPVFFVGFPRSGTTLVERALAAHPGIVTTEERSPLTPAIRRLIGRRGTPSGLESVGTAELSAARALFWQQADAAVGPLGGRLLVDKLPLNVVDLGYANLLFPDARVLVALRDPRDVCMSCFMQHFLLNDSMINFCSLEQTVETYAAVMGLWLAYRDSLTLAWHEFRYEDLVGDFETVVRSLLSFIGLGWQEAVAQYRENSTGRSVATPSYRQVSREIHRESIGRWRSYRRELAAVSAKLSPYLKAFDYPEA